MRCPLCDFENTSSNTYCENCGSYLAENPQYSNPTILSSSDAAHATSTNQAGQDEYMSFPYDPQGYQGYAPNSFDQPPYTVPPPPPSNGHNMPIEQLLPPLEPSASAIDYNNVGNFGTQSQIFDNQKVYESQSRQQSLLARIIRGCIYFFAVIIAGFGAYGALTSFSSNNLTEGIGVALIFAMLILGTAVFFLVRRRFQKLRFSQFLLWFFAITGGAFLVLVLGFVILGESSKASSFFLGIIFVLYGLVVAALALW
jgi:hypothetical protein